MAQDYHKAVKVNEHAKLEHARYNKLFRCSEWLKFWL